MKHLTSAGAHLRASKSRVVKLLVLLVIQQAASQDLQAISGNKPQQVQPNQQESVLQQQLNVLEADENALYILGLFDLHGSDPRAPFKCGPIEIDNGDRQSKRAMQNLAAFQWAIEQVNEDTGLLPGVRLGALSMDTCSSTLRTNQLVANLLHTNQSQRTLVGLVTDQADPHSVESTATMASALGLTTFVTQARSSRLSELVRKYQQQPSGLGAGHLDAASEAAAAELLLGELLGIGRMMTSTPEPHMMGSQSANFAAHQQRLLMVRMRPSNEVLAEAIAALLHRMHWDYVSLLYEEDDPDMVDLHDELARQLFHKGLQFALDERLSLRQRPDSLDRLMQELAKKSELGARVVIVLAGAGCARSLLEAQQRRRQAESRVGPPLLWLSVADREPFYSLATEALGTVAISSSSPLIGEFRAYYEHLPLGADGRRSAANKWWPEYMRAVISQSRPDVGSSPLSDCTKWATNQSSAVAKNDKCAPITLAMLASARPIVDKRLNGTSGALEGRLAAGPRYLAGGWEHNGMDTINAVLAIANGLEALRQALCPDTKIGLCERMQALLTAQSSEQQVTLSELLYNELFRSTFQLADGRMFNLDEASGQLDCKVKFYNLRYLQQNSVGFVKFATFDPNAVEGFTLNASKARYPTDSLAFKDQVSLEQLKSSCEHQSKCLMTGSGAEISASEKSSSLSEEELAVGVNSLFKLDHPLISAPVDLAKLESLASAELDERVQTMRSPAVGKQVSSASKLPSETASTFDMIVLLPLHKGKSGAHQSSADAQQRQLEESCSDRMDIERSFQRLVALAYAQNLANAPAAIQAIASVGSDQTALEQPQIKLTTTVIDYCEQPDLAYGKLAQLLASRRAGSGGNDIATKHVAVIDFDRQISERIDGLAKEHQLLHLSVGVASSSSKFDSSDEHLRVSLLPSKVAEIEALVGLLSSMPQWKLVHLIYTDQHALRDEFVRRANEADICVSKLIWVPPVHPDTDRLEAGKQVERLARLFENELHEYSSMSSRVEGLNSTRVLVVLASDSVEANQLILEASSESMRRDYIWLTSHEWLTSVEMAAQRLASLEGPQSRLPTRLPRYFMSTSLETFESHDFRRYLASLSPAIHSPIPTRWFDQFWQQNFECRLPFAATQTTATTTPASPFTQVCSAEQRLEPHQVVEDDRVHYTIQALESIYAALLATTTTASNGSQRPGITFDNHLFATNFKRAFERSRQLSSDGGDVESPLADKPYGFNIVLRLLPDEQSPEPTARRPNSRAESTLDIGLEEADYLAGGGQLLRVGLWRAGHLLMLNRDNRTANSWLRREAGSSSRANQEENIRVSRSLARLGAIRSRCSGSPSCSLCYRQIEQTQTLIRQEEARLNLSSSSHEPRALSSIMLANLKPSKKSILDNPEYSASRFDDEQTFGEQKDDIQASASSMFNTETSKQLANQYQTEVHWVQKHLMQPQRKLNQDLQTQGSLSATLLSLAGTIFMITCLAYFYPNKFGRSSDKVQSLFTGQEDKLTGSRLDNAADYLTLTGLLMLYSINIAFLLQADMNVCWFRRVGLGTSYVVVLSSVLMRSVFCLRLTKLYTLRICSEASSLTQTIQQQQAEPVEENVEVTFESLPDDQTQFNEAPTMSASGYQETQAPAVGGEQHPIENLSKKAPPKMNLTLPLTLIATQLLLSIIWIFQQPPEPTLYRYCWYCASPRHSPILFLYEPLLVLIFPAIILLASWITSLLSYHKTCLLVELEVEKSWQLETPIGSMFKQHLRKEIYEQSRSAKALVICTTLLVFVSTVMTLSMISAGRQAARYVISSNTARVSMDPAVEVPLILVYANLLSGAIIFALIFIYRLKLFAGLWTKLVRALPRVPRRSTSSSVVQLYSASSQTARLHATPNPVLRFNQPTTNDGSQTAERTNKHKESYSTLAITYAGDSPFDRSQVSTSGRQERLGLQQFNSYGTYAPIDLAASNMSATEGTSISGGGGT